MRELTEAIRFISELKAGNPAADKAEIQQAYLKIGLDEEHYGVLVRDGWEAFFSKVLSRLRDIGQEPRD